MREEFADRVDRAVELHGDWPEERLLEHVEGMARFASFGHIDEHERFAVGALLAGKTPTAAWDCRPSEIAELRKRIADDEARELAGKSPAGAQVRELRHAGRKRRR
jgi:hypothetical protein